TTDTSVLNHSIMKGLPATFTVNDEWYEYTTDSKIFDSSWNWKVMYYLVSVESPRSPAPPNHPVAWFREDADGTRFVDTPFIHTLEGANSAFFKSMLLRALEFTAGPSTCVTALSHRPGSATGGSDPRLKASGKSLRAEWEGAYRHSVWTADGRKHIIP